MIEQKKIEIKIVEKPIPEIESDAALFSLFNFLLEEKVEPNATTIESEITQPLP